MARGGKRPLPPASVIENPAEPAFLPAPELIEWARESFIDEGATLHNPEHTHLESAQIGALWTNVPNNRHGRTILGQCEIPLSGAMGKWVRGRAEAQLIGWFGTVPDFLITIDAEYAAECSDAEFCALIEHELLHCGQERDAFGAPKFRKSGLPAFAIRGHDIEEFTSIVRRYGADAAHARAFVEAATKGPEIANVRIAQACGTCQLRAA